MAKTLKVQTFIDEQPFSGFQWLTLVLCFLVIFVDGFDTAAVGFVAPSLSKALNVPPQDLKQLLTVGFFGLAVGALLVGPLADRIGRKWVLIGSLTIFGVFSLLSAEAHSLGTLTLLRFLTGTGLGAAMPNATTLTAEFCPSRHKAFLTTLMFSGFTLGSAGGGFVAAGLIPHYGWPSVFFVGGIGPILLALALLGALPESIQFLVAREARRRDAVISIMRRINPRFAVTEDVRLVGAEHSAEATFSVRRLFQDGLGFGTAMLWVACFCGLVVIYLLTSWLPTLISASGLDIANAAVVGAMFQTGGTIGSLLVSWLMDRWSAHLSIALSYLGGAMMLLLIPFLAGNLMVLAIAVFWAGFFMSGAQSSTQPLAAMYYPTLRRAGGVSWMLGIGRFGAILGALLGGTLLGMGWSLQAIIAVLALPAAVAAIAIFLKRRATPVAEFPADLTPVPR